MPEDTNMQPNSSQDNAAQPSGGVGEQNTFPPADTIHPDTQPTAVVSQPVQPVSAAEQPTVSGTGTPGFTEQSHVGMSASQLGLNHPEHKSFTDSPKKLIIWGLSLLIVLGVVFAALVATNIIVLSELKTIKYTNNNNTHYKLKFYAKHGSKQLDSGNTQLLSKVGKEGKFPLALSISSDSDISSYNKVKGCAGYTKVVDVRNNNLNQTIAVCNIIAQSVSPTGGVYVAGFIYNNNAHLVTIAQDYSGIDLSSQAAAKDALNKFGLDPYKDDIQKIITSIKVE